MADKLYIIRKYVKAPSAASAIRRERRFPVDDIWVDEEWRKNLSHNLATALGFRNIQDKKSK